MDELTQAPRPLSDAALADLHTAVRRPRYDRKGLTPGIVHIGVGNFHRAHQAWYLHRLMDMGAARDWAILGAGVRAYDAEMRENLIRQNFLTTLIERAPGHRAAEVTGAMIGYVPIEPDNAALIRAMSDPAIRIVALTVTEGGYYTAGTPPAFDAEHADIRHDAANPGAPRTAFGAMVAALRARRAAGVRAFTGLSCDNLSGNGQILQNAVVGLARLQDPGLADWIAAQASFPNSMVDCSVPATCPEERALSESFGILDAAPVSHENFRQWVLEDRFAAGRPDWDRVGATFTDDVHPYELMKIRVLNAGHQILANTGELLALETIADCMADPRVAAFFRKVQRQEILPHVPSVPGLAAADYLDLIAQRFSNEAIRDTTRRVAFDGASRHPGFVLPILRDGLAAGASVTGLALVEALWARMCLGQRETGAPIAPNDPIWPALQRAAQAARSRPAAWLAQTELYGDLATAAPFADAFTAWTARLTETGVAATLDTYLEA